MLEILKLFNVKTYLQRQVIWAAEVEQIMIPTVFSQQMILRYSVGWGAVCPALFKETKETNCRALMTMNCWKRSAMCGYEIDSEYSF